MQNVISRFLRFGTLLSTYGLIASVLLQIFARFLLPSAPSWTEEASRLFFIYAVAFSAGIALKNQEYVHLNWLFEKLPQRLQNYLLTIIASLTVILFLITAFYALQFVHMGHYERSPGMKIRMSFVFFSMFILAGSLSYFAWIDLRKTFKKYRS